MHTVDKAKLDLFTCMSLLCGGPACFAKSFALCDVRSQLMFTCIAFQSEKT